MSSYVMLASSYVIHMMYNVMIAGSHLIPTISYVPPYGVLIDPYEFIRDAYEFLRDSH